MNFNLFYFNFFSVKKYCFLFKLKNNMSRKSIDLLSSAYRSKTEANLI